VAEHDALNRLLAVLLERFHASADEETGLLDCESDEALFGNDGANYDYVM
jgi:hypothetical protein